MNHSFLLCKNGGAGERRVYSFVRVLSSALIILVALWAVQVMSSAWIRAWGDQLLQKEKFAAAESFYKTAQRIDPQNWLAKMGLGQLYYQHRFYELNPIRKHDWALKEQAAYAAAYRINPVKEEVVYGLGRVELFLGNRELGLDYLRQAANYKRFNDFYWRKLGIELRKAGLYEEALNAFQHARKLSPGNPTVNRNIQWIKARLKGGKG